MAKRSVANPTVGVKEYITALTTFKTVGQFACLDDVVPKMTSESRGVRPADIIGLARLFEYLLLNGSSNGMIYPSQFEAATVRFLAEHPLRTTTLAPEIFAHRFTEHVKVCFSMLRLLQMEDSQVTAKVRFPKTGGFRKNVTTAEWIVLKGLEPVQMTRRTRRHLH